MTNETKEQDTLLARVAVAETEVEKLQAEIETLRGPIGRLRERAERAEQERDELSESALNRERLGLESKLATMEAERDALREQLRQADSVRNALARRADRQRTGWRKVFFAMKAERDTALAKLAEYDEVCATRAEFLARAMTAEAESLRIYRETRDKSEQQQKEWTELLTRAETAEAEVERLRGDVDWHKAQLELRDELATSSAARAEQAERERDAWRERYETMERDAVRAWKEKQ